jgi:ABC-2 type transport system ATP-binding protein
MDHGRLLALDTPDALTSTLPGSAMLEITVDDEDRPDDLADHLAQLGGVERVERVEAGRGGGPAGAAPPRTPGQAPRPGPSAGGASTGGTTRPVVARLYLTGQAAQLIAPVSDLLARRGARLAGVQLAQPSLEDVFIELTGRALR